jgi:hypothetical protein
MAFTKSLYYPWIDIRDEGWLKSASLYWEIIQTIVPETIDAPYSTKTARYLEDEGILVPLRVKSDLDEIEELAPDVIRYLESQEGIELLTGADRGYVYLHPDKLPTSIRRLSRIHPMKISMEIRHMLREHGLMRQAKDDFLEVDEKFGSFYMTLLATRLSERIGAGLVTSSALPHKLSLKAKADSYIDRIINLGGRYRDEYEYEMRHRRSSIPREMTQGMLVELLIEEIALDPETPIDKILKYRNKHSSELGRFRKKVGELTSSFPDDASLPAMRQYVNDLYLNEVKPSMDDLKSSLKSSRIKWLANSWMKLAFISAGSSSMLIGLGLATANALLVGAGISLIGSGILYNEDKKDSLRANPYSYLMPLKSELA